MDFHPPRFSQPVDLDAHLRKLPAGATCRGLYFLTPLAQLQRVAPQHELLRPGQLGGRRYVAFSTYPYADFLRLLVAVAPVIHPGLPPGEGLRRLGQGGYDALLSNHIGRVIFGVFGRDFERVVMAGPRGYDVSVNFGSLRSELVAPRHVRYHFTGRPIFLETYQVGIIEGGMRACKVAGEVRVLLDDIDRGTFDIRW